MLPATFITITSRAANIEQVIEETTDYVVTALNTPVPVQIQEALKSTGGSESQDII